METGEVLPIDAVRVEDGQSAAGESGEDDIVVVNEIALQLAGVHLRIAVHVVELQQAVFLFE